MLRDGDPPFPNGLPMSKLTSDHALDGLALLDQMVAVENANSAHPSIASSSCTRALSRAAVDGEGGKLSKPPS